MTSEVKDFLLCVVACVGGGVIATLHAHAKESRAFLAGMKAGKQEVLDEVRAAITTPEVLDEVRAAITTPAPEPPVDIRFPSVRCQCCKQQEATVVIDGIGQVCVPCQHAIEHIGIYLDSPRFDLRK